MASRKSPWLRPRNIVLGVIALAIIAYVAWRLLAPPPPPNYLTAPVRLESLEESVLATGSIEANKLVNVGSQVSGQIKSLKVKLGDKVRKGDLIAEIDSMPQQNALRNAEAALASAQAQLAAQQATATQNAQAYQRARTLFEQDAGSRETMETAEASAKSAQANVRATQAQIEQARISADTARLNLGYTRIVAPMDGTVVAVLNEEGTTVNANQSAPSIIKLARMDTVTVSAQISEADVTRVKAGQKVYFTILGEPDKRYTSTLRAIEPAPESINTTTSTTTTTTSTAIYYNGLLDVANPDDKLRISMTAQVHIVLAEAGQALSIPSAALGEQDKEGRYTVRVLDAKGVPQNRKVRVGLNNNTSAQVLEGLQKDELVVLGEATPGSAPADTGRRRMRPPM